MRPPGWRFSSSLTLPETRVFFFLALAVHFFVSYSLFATTKNVLPHKFFSRNLLIGKTNIFFNLVLWGGGWLFLWNTYFPEYLFYWKNSSFIFYFVGSKPHLFFTNNWFQLTSLIDFECEFISGFWEKTFKTIFI